MTRLALALALLAALPARADVEVTLELQGYSALFQECEMQIALTQASEPMDKVTLQYAIDIRDKAVVHCTLNATVDGQLETQCDGDLDVDHQCEDIARIRLIGIGCFDAGASELPCGAVSLTGPKADFFVFD